jgi:tetratricopeptide (TPR) repeat protein
MLLTGLRERERAVARTTGLVPGAAAGLDRWLTWRKALLGGGLAFGALAAVAGAYTAMRLLGIGPVGTLVASGVLKDREPLVLADFENRTADSTLGPSLTEAFRVDLSQSPTIRLLDASSIADALRRMERAESGNLPAPLARELAEREGIKGVVTGQVAPVGKGYVLSANLLGAADGHVLTAVRENAENDGQLLDAIGRLSKKLRERVGESLVSIRETAPLQQVTTASLPALRRYSEALRLEEDDKVEAAIAALREAVALDTGFAMAYRKLAVLIGNTGGDDAAQSEAATRAFAHRDRLPELEGDQTAGYYYQWVAYDSSATVAAYRAALNLDPDNLPALNNLAVELGRRRRYVEAESLVVRATHLGRGASFFQNAILYQVAQGHFAAADSTLTRYAAKSPASPVLLALRAQMGAARQDYAAAIRLLLQLRAAQAASPAWQAVTSFELSRLSLLTGRLADAERYLRANMEVLESKGQTGEYVGRSGELALVESEMRGRPDSATAILAAALAKYPLGGIPLLNRPYVGLAIAYGTMGKPADARRIWKEYEAAVPESVRRGDRLGELAAGLVAEADHRPDQAESDYRGWYAGSGECGPCGLFELAKLADSAGRTDSALALYDRGINLPSLTRYRYDAYRLPEALKRSGELYEAKGDRARAADRYRRLVDLWKDADPELQPGVRELRARLARLATEPGT